ncbi:uncharacterized protein BP5553_02510 [Venustampulla echinocandica]|uniref:RING-type domain-containing protein n=1 Tax=Venustampulla echinocandica TaxID=2656787 RepID=A0A370U426_9HELO|nr:uncharacterized protein BP5553_02510 [Venustampulla echinocandica]RDL42531.1 hypothetical protein BP5553_02510 [Venustampulla echinocandica]
MSSTVSSAPSPSLSPTPSPASTGGGGGPTNSPLLFFVALGFGVVFTNLWIIVGVKYCFRYNARNRAIRNGEDVDPINLENMPPRPHRRRREKKLMTMDEVNDRFPLTKYKNWVASRVSEGLPATGGVTARSSRAGSLRDADGVVPSSPVDTKHSINTRPATANSEIKAAGVTTATTEEKPVEPKPEPVEEVHNLEEVRTTTSTVDKHPIVASEMDDDDEDDHIHTAVPPELLTNPGDSCAICIDTLENDDDIRGLTCGHAFHAGCLDPWLTSRRACCPLCKADYFTPKPRPEGETAETTRAQRRRDQRMNMPQQPTTSWIGIRGNPRLIFPSRFGSQVYPDQPGYDESQSRRGRRSRRHAAAQGQSGTAAPENTAAENVDTTSSGPWRPRFTNPFGGMRMPAALRVPGRNRQQAGQAEQNPTAEPSPSQLEAGIVR